MEELEILLPGMQNLLDFGIREHGVERIEVREGSAVEHGQLRRSCHLHDLQLRQIGPLAKKFGIQSETLLTGKMRANGTESLLGIHVGKIEIGRCLHGKAHDGNRRGPQPLV